MSLTQFPPSSPLAESPAFDTRALDHPFAPKRLAFSGHKSQVEYPTPHPSSAVGQSSPSRGGLVEPVGLRRNKDFNILDPHDAVVRVSLPGSASHVTIGRSHQSSDVQLDPTNKTISRAHIKASYNEQQIVLQCLGFNGFAMRIPRPCLVFATNRRNDYILLENKGSVLDAANLEPTTRKSVVLDANHTEFVVNRNETVTLPRLSNILIEVRGSLVLLNPEDEEDTDEETPVLLTRAHARSESTPPVSTPFKRPITPATPAKSGHKITSEELTPLPKSRAATPLGDITNSINMAANAGAHSALNSAVNSAVSTPKASKKRLIKADEPAKRKKKQAADHQEVEVSLASIKGLKKQSEIENVLTNHLAYSRLSSTPASFLLSISVLTGQLDLLQLRTILHNIKCVGVIHREGKDAAGKPLEEEYYYMPENDEDKERPALVQTIRGHGGLRACRRTHKQYFWKKPAPIKK